MHGTFKEDRPKHCILLTKTALENKTNLTDEALLKRLARTKDEFSFGHTTLIDYDYDPRMGDPLDYPALWAALVDLWPGFKDAGHIMFPSTSAGIWNKETGEQVLKDAAHGLRLWLIVKDPEDIQRFFEQLRRLSIIAGYGWIHISKSGAASVRTLFDTSVYTPERLDFCAGATVEAPLERRGGEKVVVDAEFIDTRALPKCTIAQINECDQIETALMAAAADDIAAAVAAYHESEIVKLVERGVERERALVVVDARQSMRLEADDLLYFDHLKDPVTVAAVQAEPKAFDNKSLRDPLEPEERGKAKFWINNGTSVIHSFLHGGRNFKLPTKQTAVGDLELQINQNGVPIKTLNNLRLWLRELGILCQHDIFHDTVLIAGNVVQDYQGQLCDNAEILVKTAVAGAYNFEFPLSQVHEAIMTEALLNAFDPVCDYLAGLQWDGVNRLDTWTTRYLGTPDTPLNRAIGRIALIAMVRRARKPGCKFDTAIVLEAPEGNEKSTFILTLAGSDDNFSDQDLLDTRTQEQAEALQGIWAYEIAEMVGRKKADINRVKAFVSRTTDRVRRAYGRNRVDAPRRCVFWATTNEAQYLTSDTGNRRWLPLPTSTIDIPSVKADRDQLFAEAALAEDRGESITLPKPLWAAAAAEQEARLEHDPWIDIIEAKLAGIGRVTSLYVLMRVLDISMERQNTALFRRLSSVMQRIGWETNKNVPWAGDRTRGYLRGDRKGPADEFTSDEDWLMEKRLNHPKF